MLRHVPSFEEGLATQLTSFLANNVGGINCQAKNSTSWPQMADSPKD